jgi:hypothetical protein
MKGSAKKAFPPPKREHPVLLLLAGILLFGLAFSVDALRKSSQPVTGEKMPLEIATLFSVLFVGGGFLIIRSLVLFHKKGYKLPEVILGIALMGAGVLISVFMVTHIKGIVGATRGSAIFLGPIGMPTVVFALVIPLIGILCSIVGVLVFLRAVSPRIRRKLR